MKSSPGYGGYAEVARHLEAVTGRKVTRQQVYQWFLRRELNDFPAPDPGMGGFDLALAEEWLLRYWSTRHHLRSLAPQADQGSAA